MSVHYILKDATGQVVQRGVCQSAAEIPQMPGFLSEQIGPQDPRHPPADLPKTVDEVRRIDYPTVGDQLGAIWKAIAPLIEHPEAEAILAKIKAVKDANPKP